MDTRNILTLKIYDTLGSYKFDEEKLQKVRDKKLYCYIYHHCGIVSSIYLLMTNKINCTNHVNRIPIISKRIYKNIFIVKGISYKCENFYHTCCHCHCNTHTYMIRKSKSLWITVCDFCLIKLLNATNKLKIYYFTREVNYKIMMMYEFLLYDIANYIKMIFVYQCIDLLISF